MRIFGNNPILTGVNYQAKRFYRNDNDAFCISQYRRCIKLLEKCPRHAFLTRSLLHSSLGEYSRHLKNYSLALRHYQLSFDFFEKEFGGAHHVCALKVTDVAKMTMKLGKVAEALAMHKDCLRRRINIYGVYSPATAEAHFEIGLCYLKLNDLEASSDHFKAALKIYRKFKYFNGYILEIQQYLAEIQEKKRAMKKPS